MKAPSAAITVSIIVLIGIMLRLIFLFSSAGEIESDEAIVGLMGRHILQGEFPLYYYGQQYMGSLEGYLAAFLFLFFGSSPLILKLVPFSISILFIITVYLLMKELYGRRTALMGILFTAIPPYFLTIWSLKARGGYIETLVTGTIILLLTSKVIMCERQKKQYILFAVLGLICGFSSWINQMSAYYIVTAFICFLIYPAGREILWKRKIILWKGTNIYKNSISSKISNYFGRFLNLLIICELVIVFITINEGGFNVKLGWGISAKFDSMLESLLWIFCFIILYMLFSKKNALTIPFGIIFFLIFFTIGNFPTCIHKIFFPTEASPTTFDTENLIAYFNNFWKQGIPIIIGIKKTWVLTSVFPLILESGIVIIYVLSLVYFLAYAVREVYRSKTTPPLGYLLPIIMFLSTAIIYSITEYGWFVQEPRYLLPLYTILPVFPSVLVIALMKRRQIFLWLITAFLVFFLVFCNFKSNMSYYKKTKFTSTNIPLADKEVIDFLESMNTRYAYAYYWTAYKLIFESNENIICTSLNHERYPTYSRMVSEQKQPAYIMEGVEKEPFENLLKEYNIDYKVKNIGTYWIYYSISIPQIELLRNHFRKF